MIEIRLSLSRVSFRLFLLLGGLCLGAGCGGEKLASVSGKVTKGGQPLTTGTVTFHPAPGNTDARLASSEIGPDGQYTIQAVPGSYKVTVFAEEARPEEGPEAYAEPVYLVAEEYRTPETTPLSYELKSGSEETYDIEITE
ncbi:MAG: hypothetical protein KY475_00280 [Planctomycetes bacterium]|nr:hypothetical protein [Planctomycetota bacterium]